MNIKQMATACCMLGGALMAAATVKAKVLTGDSPDAFNTIENPDRVHIETATLAVKEGTVEIPAHTVTILYVE